MSESSPGRRNKPVGQQWRQHLSQWLDQRVSPESGIIMFTALLVGVLSGLGAVIFRWLIKGVHALAYDGLGGLLESIVPFHLLIIPAIGGAIFGPLIYRFAREAKGPGVSEVIEAVALRGGRIRPRVALIKALASSICIGTGGSVGCEGPVVQIGSVLGSTVGQTLKLSAERLRNLVACGAAGGIAATFNAPIAGSLFALEVILGQFHAVYFGAVVISAVTADVIAHIFEGDLRVFSVPEYILVSPWELVFYTVLGGLAALVSISFTRLLYLSNDLWDKIRFPEYLKPVLGGLLLGSVGIFTFKFDGYPRVFGVGYDSISQALFGELAVRMTLALLFIKLFATILTLGSGGSGGIFAPSLFMGAMLGSSFGHVVHEFFPSITAPSGAYALVGMAAFFSGATHAPVTAILTLFEMSGDYQIILPLMLATVISPLISRFFSRESIYTLKLARRGIHLQQGQDIDVMQGVTVGEAMTTDVDAVPLNMPLAVLLDEFVSTHNHGFPVLDDAGELVGVVSIRDLERAQGTGTIEGKMVADIATTDGLLVAYPYEPMWRALRRLGIHDVSRLPVVEQEGSRRLVGVVRRRDIIQAYHHAIVKQAHRHVAHGYTVLQGGDRVTVFATQDCIPIIRQRLAGDSAGDEKSKQRRVRHREFTIPAGASCAAKMVRELTLPSDCILVSISREDKPIIPHGNTVLQAGDVVELFGAEDELSEAELCLSR